MTINEINSTKTALTTKSLLKKKLLILSAVFFAVYTVILIIPTLTITPVDWLLGHLRGVTFVDSWTPGTMVYSVLLVLLPLIYIAAAIIIFVIDRRDHTIK